MATRTCEPDADTKTRHHASVGLLFERRFDRAAPRPFVLFDQLLGRRHAARDDLVEGVEIAPLIAAADVEACAPRQALMREHQAIARQGAHAAATDRRLEAELRHLVAQ